MGVDYYNILKVNRNATEEDVKKAYKRMAMIWHPDKNPSTNKRDSEAKFNLISEAYDVLTDPLKRQIYDLYGEEALKSSSSSIHHNHTHYPPSSSSSRGPHHNRNHPPHPSSSSFRFNPRDAEDIYAELFADQAGGGSGGGRQYKEGYFGHSGSSAGTGRKAAAVENQLPCSLEELYKGARKKMKISRTITEASGFPLIPPCGF